MVGGGADRQQQCRVCVDGNALDAAIRARLVRVEVELDAELFAQCTLTFHDPALALIDGDRFRSGTRVAVELGCAGSLQQVFEGEVVSLEPRFRRDLPPSLRVLCLTSLHRLALSQATRAFNDVDHRQIATTIAREHGLSCEAPAGSREHVLQANVTDAVFLRRLTQQHGNQLRLVGTRLVIAPPAGGQSVLTLSAAEGLLKKVKVKVRANQQVGAVSVHGWDAGNKREIVSRAEAQGDAGEGARLHGGEATVSLAGGHPAPRDTAAAESMARGRMRKLAERFVTAEIETAGDPRLVPGALFALEKLDAHVDGKYRVDRAAHVFDKHGYRLSLRAARVEKLPPPRPAPAPPLREEDHYVHFDVVDAQGRPAAGAAEAFLEHPGGREERVRLSGGRLRKRNVAAGIYAVHLPGFSEARWTTEELAEGAEVGLRVRQRGQQAGSPVTFLVFREHDEHGEALAQLTGRAAATDATAVWHAPRTTQGTGSRYVFYAGAGGKFTRSTNVLTVRR